MIIENKQYDSPQTDNDSLCQLMLRKETNDAK